MPPKESPNPTESAADELTPARAAKAVKRELPILGDDGKPTGKTKLVAVEAAEVLSWAVRDTAIAVVTKDGQKLLGVL